jgi:hypothetical protein
MYGDPSTEREVEDPPSGYAHHHVAMHPGAVVFVEVLHGSPMLGVWMLWRVECVASEVDGLPWTYLSEQVTRERAAAELSRRRRA